jgi:putative membrane protein insertion efficiency factor
MKRILIMLISVYQKTLSPDHGIIKKIGIVTKPVCVFYPTCSEYAKDAINKYGPLQGSWKAFLRILRCHPWQKNHIDPA